MKKFIVFVVITVCTAWALRAQAVFDLQVLPMCWQVDANTDSTIFAYWLLSSRDTLPAVKNYINADGTDVTITGGTLTPGYCGQIVAAMLLDSMDVKEDSIIVLYAADGTEITRDTVGPFAGGGGSAFAVIASNGLNDKDPTGDVDVELGGDLERNTTIDGRDTYAVVWDSLAGWRVSVRLAGDSTVVTQTPTFFEIVASDGVMSIGDGGNFITLGAVGATYNLPWSDPDDNALPPGEYLPLVDELGALAGTGGWIHRDSVGGPDKQLGTHDQTITDPRTIDHDTFTLSHEIFLIDTARWAIAHVGSPKDTLGSWIDNQSVPSWLYNRFRNPANKRLLWDIYESYHVFGNALDSLAIYANGMSINGLIEQTEIPHVLVIDTLNKSIYYSPVKNGIYGGTDSLSQDGATNSLMSGTQSWRIGNTGIQSDYGVSYIELDNKRDVNFGESFFRTNIGDDYGTSGNHTTTEQSEYQLTRNIYGYDTGTPISIFSESWTSFGSGGFSYYSPGKARTSLSMGNGTTSSFFNFRTAPASNSETAEVFSNTNDTTFICGLGARLENPTPYTFKAFLGNPISISGPFTGATYGDGRLKYAVQQGTTPNYYYDWFKIDLDTNTPDTGQHKVSFYNESYFMPNYEPDTASGALSLIAFEGNGLGNDPRIISISDYTGWAEYRDTTFTSASPLSLSASTKITLPNNSDVVVDGQKPVDITSFYSSADSTILGRNGDGLNVLVEFVAVPQSVAAEYIDTSIDIAGSVGEIYPRTHTFSKGVGVEKYVSFSVGGYTLDTWESNGGKVKVISNGPVDIYNIRYVLTRTHKAR